MRRLIVLATLLGGSGCSGFTRIQTPPAPRAISPLSGATVNTSRPTLEFALPATVTQPIIDLCSQRACGQTAMTATVDENGTAVPDRDLAAGVWWWRIRGSSPMGPTTSAVWQFTVAPQTAARASSSGASLDLDGDGLAELAVGGPQTLSSGGRVFIYAGSSSGPDPSRVTVLDAPNGDGQFGHALAAVDFDGDGYVDLAVGAPALPSASGTIAGAVYVYRGGPDGVKSPPDFVLTVDTAGDLGWSLDFAGDFNGDGYGDLVAGAPTTSLGGVITGAAYLFAGGPQLDSVVTTLSPDSDSLAQVGWSVAGGGDVDGDGFDDIVIGAPALSTNGSGKAFLYRGATIGSSVPVPLDWGAPANAQQGFAVALSGDFDGDGLADPVVASPGAGAGRVQLFNAAGTPTVTSHLNGPDGPGSRFGVSLAVGDIDGDGRSDLAVGAGCVVAGGVCIGRAYLVVAGAITSLPAPDGSDDFTLALALGDSDGDGRAELSVGDPDRGGSLGRVDWFGDGAAGPTASRVFNGSDSAGRFGFSLR